MLKQILRSIKQLCVFGISFLFGLDHYEMEDIFVDNKEPEN